MDLQCLWELQETDQRLKKLLQESKQKKMVHALRNEMAIIKQKEESFQQLTAEIGRLNKSIKISEQKLQMLQEQKKDFEERLYSGQTNIIREMESMENKIKQIAEKIKNLEEEILVSMEYSDEQTKLHKETDLQLKMQKKNYRQKYKTYQLRKKEFEIAQDQVLKTKEMLLAAIPEEMLKKYNQLQAKYKLNGIACLVDDRCSGCKINISRIQTQAIKQGGQTVYCEYCGRLIVCETSDGAN